MKLLVATASVLCLAATGADAAVQVLNASFEENQLSDGDFKFAMNNWQTASNAGVANPTSAVFPEIPDGQNTAFLGSGIDENGPYGGLMRQVGATTVEGDTRYKFSIDVGRSDGLDLADFRVSFLVGGQVVGLGSFTNADIAPGAFKTLSFSFDNLADVLGYEIRLETFWNADQGSAYRQVNFDNVRVEATPLTPGGAVPEPATWAMMILGLGGVGAVLRSRRGGLVAASPA